MKAAGFSLGATGHWLFCDAADRWWVLVDEFGDLLGPTGAEDEPPCWYVPRDHFSTDALPHKFFTAMGGGYGSLEWAFEVVGRIRFLRRARGKRLERVAGLSRLLALPEWQAFAQAVARRGEPALNATLHQIRYVADEGGASSVVTGAFRDGFEFGDALGFLAAANAVRRSEASRNQGKVELRAMLRQIAVEEAAKGPLRPYVLANTLIRERKDGVSRGLQLGRLGLAADANRVGVIIREEALAAGLLS